MSFPATRTRLLDDFAIRLLRKTDKGDPVNAVTPDYPIYHKFKGRNEARGKGRTLTREAPGEAVTSRILYQVQDRGTDVSVNTGITTQNQTPIDPYTEARFPYVASIETVTIPLYKLYNVRNQNVYRDMVLEHKEVAELSAKERSNNWLWNGATVDGVPIFGIKDAIRVNPAVNPARGMVGGLDAVNASYGDRVRNRVQNFGEAAYTLSGGDRALNMIGNDAGTKGMELLFKDCSYNSMGAAGKPDLFVMNWMAYNAYTRIVQNRNEFRNREASADLGLPDDYWFKNGPVYYDEGAGDDTAAVTPNTGTVYMLNTNMFDVVMAQGLEKHWESEGKLQGKTAFSWYMYSQWTIKWRGQRWMGLMHNIEAGSSVTST